jgi:hypothetical protein
MTKRRSLGVLLAGVVIAVTCTAFVVGLILLIVTHRRNPRRAPPADTAAQWGDGPGQWPVRRS